MVGKRNGIPLKGRFIHDTHIKKSAIENDIGSAAAFRHTCRRALAGKRHRHDEINRLGNQPIQDTPVSI
jgi:hypothetical protein